MKNLFVLSVFAIVIFSCNNKKQENLISQNNDVNKNNDERKNLIVMLGTDGTEYEVRNRRILFEDETMYIVSNRGNASSRYTAFLKGEREFDEISELLKIKKLDIGASQVNILEFSTSLPLEKAAEELKEYIF